jgi:hypothetical protein
MFRCVSLILIFVIGGSWLVFANELVGIQLGSPKFQKTAVDLRRTFNKVIQSQRTAPQSAVIEKFLPYIKNFEKQFIVLGVRDGDFGGLWVTIVINPENMRFWRVWIYPVGQERFELREIEEMALIPSEKEKFLRLLSARYRKYWQSPNS